MIRIALVASAIWLVALAAYGLTFPHLFIRMFPHEVGELLTGWFAPVAFIWVGVTVALQRQQLAAQNQELKHSSDALALQSKQFQKSVDLLERNSLCTRMERLAERLMLGILRACRLSENHRLRSPGGQTTTLGVLIGPYRAYTELFRGKEVERAMERFGEGLAAVSRDLNADWAADADWELDELCVELTSLDRITTEMIRLAGAMDSADVLDTARPAVLESFVLRVREAHDILYGMLHDAEDLAEAD